MSLLEKLKRRLQGKTDDTDPWETLVNPEVTDEELEEAVKTMTQTVPKPKTRVIGLMFFVILWTVGHLFPLYVMIGTPISAGILLYVIVNIMIFGHYFTLLNKERIQ